MDVSVPPGGIDKEKSVGSESIDEDALSLSVSDREVKYILLGRIALLLRLLLRKVSL